MAQTAAEKLVITSTPTIRVEGSVPDSVHDHLGQSLTDPAVVTGPGADVLIFYADGPTAVDQQAREFFDQVALGGRFWIAYRKGATRDPSAGEDGSEPLHRDSLQRSLDPQGLVGVTLIALDDTWSAMRVKSVTT